jgi:hypothetical protein
MTWKAPILEQMPLPWARRVSGGPPQQRCRLRVGNGDRDAVNERGSCTPGNKGAARQRGARAHPCVRFFLSSQRLRATTTPCPRGVGLCGIAVPVAFQALAFSGTRLPFRCAAVCPGAAGRRRGTEMNTKWSPPGHTDGVAAQGHVGRRIWADRFCFEDRRCVQEAVVRTSPAAGTCAPKRAPKHQPRASLASSKNTTATAIPQPAHPRASSQATARKA